MYGRFARRPKKFLASRGLSRPEAIVVGIVVYCLPDCPNNHVVLAILNLTKEDKAPSQDGNGIERSKRCQNMKLVAMPGMFFPQLKNNLWSGVFKT